MTDPLSEERLGEIEQDAKEYVRLDVRSSEIEALVAEVRRLRIELDEAKAHEEKAYESRAHWCIEAGKEMKERDARPLLTEDQITFVDVIMEKEIEDAIREKKDGYGKLAHFIWGIRDTLKKIIPTAAPDPYKPLTPAEVRARNYRQWGGDCPIAPDPFDDPVR